MAAVVMGVALEAAKVEEMVAEEPEEGRVAEGLEVGSAGGRAWGWAHPLAEVVNACGRLHKCARKLPTRLRVNEVQR